VDRLVDLPQEDPVAWTAFAWVDRADELVDKVIAWLDAYLKSGLPATVDRID
jgi:hypothetical protein